MIRDEGGNNYVDVDRDVMESAEGNILLLGSNITVSIGPNVAMSGAGITLGDDCSLIVGADCRLAAIEIMGSRRGHVVIGPRCDFTWSTKLYLHEPGRVVLGSDCLIASGTLLTNSDMHSIIDVESGERLNPADDVILGDRVWLAHEATVLKGSCIGSDSVVGHRAVVGGAIPPNSLAAGIPARVVRTGIIWDRRLL